MDGATNAVVGLIKNSAMVSSSQIIQHPDSVNLKNPG